MRRSMSYLVAALIVFGALPSAAFASDTMDMLFMDIPTVVGTLTQTDANKSPVSVTTITSDQIAITPARNMYDLLEVYVPGFISMTHFDSTKMGLRGLISDRNNTYILLVNGRMVNQRSHDGALTELENWDMNDIQKIEVIRGPGSVTYGPGAVAGVISITTKNAVTSPGTNFGLQYVGTYNSGGAYVSQALKGDGFNMYLYGSLTRTDGQQNPSIYAAAPVNQNAGYVANTNTSSNGNPLQPYMADYMNQPQLKLYGQLDFAKEWKLWARMVNSGTTRMVTWVGASAFQKSFNINTGKWETNPQTEVAQNTVALENNHIFSPTTDLKTMVSFNSTNNQRMDSNGTVSNSGYVLNYAEYETLAKSVLSYHPSETLKMAIGAEFEYNRVTEPWGTYDPLMFIVDDGVDYYASTTAVAANGNGARSWQGNRIFTDSFDLYNGAIFGEISKSLTSKLDVIVSVRADQNVYSKIAISPRLAMILNEDNYGIYKLSLQRSVRENTMAQLYAAHYFGNPLPYQEIYNDIELGWNKKVGNVGLEAVGYWSKADLLGWNAAGGNAAGAVRTTSPAGTLTMGGVELVAEYKTDSLTVGLNHSYSKQIDFTLPSDVQNSYISNSANSDAFVDGNLGIRVPAYGGDRMNWANNQTKLYSIAKLADKWTLFDDARIAWGYEGNKNYLEQILIGSNGAAAANVNDVKDNGLFNTDVKIDLALAYQATSALKLIVYGQNIVKFTHAWQYMYIMESIAAVDEPTVVGVRANYKF